MRIFASSLGLVLVIVAPASISGCSGGGQSLSETNVYASLAEGGIYCDSERVEQQESYILRSDGTTESASPYGPYKAMCYNDGGDFHVFIWPSSSSMAEDFAGCDKADSDGFVSYGGNWVASWGGLEDLTRQEADRVSKALQGTTATWGEACSAIAG